MHISGQFNKIKKQGIGAVKQDIQVQSTIENRTLELSAKTRQNIAKLLDVIGDHRIFGRNDVMNVLGITASPASALIRKMRDAEIIEPVKGYGKGKYHFIV